MSERFFCIWHGYRLFTWNWEGSTRYFFYLEPPEEAWKVSLQPTSLPALIVFVVIDSTSSPKVSANHNALVADSLTWIAFSWAWTGGYLLHSMVCIATSTPLWWLYCNMRYFLHTYSVMQYYLQGMLMYNLLLKQNSCTRYFLCCCWFMASQIQKNPEIGHETRVQVKLGGDGPRFSHASSFILFSKTAKNVLSGHGKLFTLQYQLYIASFLGCSLEVTKMNILWRLSVDLVGTIIIINTKTK